MPYSTVVAGTVITASWANANVRDQVVTPFTDSTARGSAISSPVEGMVSYLQDVNRFDFWNGAAWQPVAGVGAKAIRNGVQLIPHNTITSVEWQAVVYDPHGMWSGANPTRLTAPWTGFYAASASVNWNSSLSGQFRRAGLYLVGNAEDLTSDHLGNLTSPVGDIPHRQNVAASGLFMTAGQYVEFRLTQDSGGDRGLDTVGTDMKLAYLGPAA